MSHDVVVPRGADPDARERHRDELHVNFSSSSPLDQDCELLAIQDRLSPFLTLLGSRLGVPETLAQLSASHSETVDLICHTTRQNLLALGEWVVGLNRETNAFCTEAGPILDALNIKKLRLVGCYVADGLEAANTLAALRDRLGLDVVGTSSMVCDRPEDFDYHGCVSHNFSRGNPDGLITPARIAAELAGIPTFASEVDRDDLRTLAPPPPAARWRSYDLARPAATAILDTLETRFWRLPGLLREPNGTLTFPANDNGSAGSLQLLFDGALVRVYPNGEPSRVYQPRDLGALRAAVTSAITDPRARSELLGNS
jgi:hypothetical protein